MVIDIGMIAYGPELDRRPIFGAVQRLRNVLERGGQAAQLEIVYLIPGSLGPPEVKGFSIARRRGKDRRLIVYVDVPADLVLAKDPIPGLVDLAHQAIGVARAAPASKSRSDEFASAANEFSKAAAELIGDQASNTDHGSAVGRTYAEQPHDALLDDEMAQLIVVLQADSAAALEEAFHVQELIDARLRDTGIGYVDGNQVGEGVFEIFAEGPDLPVLEDGVAAIVKTNWSGRPPKFVRSRRLAQ